MGGYCKDGSSRSGMGTWTRLIWLRIGTGGGHLETWYWTFGFHSVWGISSLPENQLASQGLSTMEYVCMYEWMKSTHLIKWCNFQWKPCLVVCVTKHKENQFLTMFIALSFATVDCVWCLNIQTNEVGPTRNGKEERGKYRYEVILRHWERFSPKRTVWNCGLHLT